MVRDFGAGIFGGGGVVAAVLEGVKVFWFKVNIPSEKLVRQL
jgi:hypothetical protein